MQTRTNTIMVREGAMICKLVLALQTACSHQKAQVRACIISAATLLLLEVQPTANWLLPASLGHNPTLNPDLQP